MPTTAKRLALYKAIETRYLGPTNHRGSRILATDMDHNRIYFSECGGYDDMSIEERHQAAAYALCKKMGWKGVLKGGGTKKGYVWVFDYEVES